MIAPRLQNSDGLTTTAALLLAGSALLIIVMAVMVMGHLMLNG